MRYIQYCLTESKTQKPSEQTNVLGHKSKVYEERLGFILKISWTAVRSLNESPLFSFQCDKQLKTVRAEKNLMKQRANLKGKSQ